MKAIDEQREKDIQSLCNGVLSTGVRSTGDSGSGGECPFCYKSCGWNDDLSQIDHKQNCIYLIAKDLSTNL